MNEIPEELLLYRTQLRTAVERDLRRHTPRLRVMQQRSVRLAVPTVAVLAAAAAAVLGLTLSAASPEKASAAARKALAATAAAPSGTMTTSVLHGGVTHTLETTRWNGSDLAFSPGLGSIFSPADSSIRQLLLIGGGAYVQASDGTWLHYANASDVAPKPLGGMAQYAQDNIAGTNAQQILALATGVQKTTQPDGTTVYTGTIPNSTAPPENATGDEAIMGMIFGSRKQTEGAARGGHLTDSQLQMSVGGDGLVRQVSVTFQHEDAGSPSVDGTYTWGITYSQLGSTPPITAPSSSTDVPPGTLPQNRQTQTNGGPATQAEQTRTQLADELSFARCMRRRGVARFPDPTAQGGLSLEMVRAQGIDLRSPTVLRVVNACLPASHGALTPAKVRAALKDSRG